MKQSSRFDMKYLKSSPLPGNAHHLEHQDSINMQNPTGKAVDSRIIFINERELIKDKKIFYTKATNDQYNRRYPKKAQCN